MPVPGYSAWSVTAGEQPTTAYWNILGSNDAAFNTALTGNGTISAVALTVPYSFSYHQSTSQTIPNAAFTKVTFDTKDYDIGSNVSSSKFTAPVAGEYRIASTVDLLTIQDTATDISIYKNGAEIYRFQQMTGGNTSSTTTAVSIEKKLSLAASDYIEIYVYQSQGSSASTNSSSSPITTWFDGELVSYS